MTVNQTKTARQEAAATIHRHIISSVNKLLRRAPAVKLAQVAKETGKDPRTVKYHLELLEASGDVVFLDPDHSVLGSPQTLAKAIQGAVREPWDRIGAEDLRDVWDNEADERWNHV